MVRNRPVCSTSSNLQTSSHLRCLWMEAFARLEGLQGRHSKPDGEQDSVSDISSQARLSGHFCPRSVWFYLRSKCVETGRLLHQQRGEELLLALRQGSPGLRRLDRFLGERCDRCQMQLARGGRLLPRGVLCRVPAFASGTRQRKNRFIHSFIYGFICRQA